MPFPDDEIKREREKQYEFVRIREFLKSNCASDDFETVSDILQRGIDRSVQKEEDLRTLGSQARRNDRLSRIESTVNEIHERQAVQYEFDDKKPARWADTRKDPVVMEIVDHLVLVYDIPRRMVSRCFRELVKYYDRQGLLPPHSEKNLRSWQSYVYKAIDDNAAGLYECPLKTATRHIDHETVMRLLSSILKGN